MNIYIDCEWNDFEGALISVALVPQEIVGASEFYIEFELPDNLIITPWVLDNVMCHTTGKRYSLEYAQKALANYLQFFERVHIIADWPEDIERFCKLLITGPGKRLNTPPLTMEVIRKDAPSKVPHHALHDARGLRDAMLIGGSGE